MTVLGVAAPAVEWWTEGVSSAGVEAVDLARMAGLELDGWQQLILRAALQERADGKWQHFEVGACVPRQNGKGGLIEARQLAGLFLLGERLIIHSAHQFDTSLEAFRRLLMLIEDTPELDGRVKRVSRAHGDEGIELSSGQRIRFRTRTKGGGRGFTGDCLLLDEAMILQEAAHGALLPTLSARPNPQVWYLGSAVDQAVHDHGVVFARVRERGHAGEDGALAWFEYSTGHDHPDDVPDGVLDDVEWWRRANPAAGIRITDEHIALERQSLATRTFCVERLGVGDWPATAAGGQSVFSIDVWRSLEDRDSVPQDPVWLAFDVSPDRSWGSIGVAGIRDDGLVHIEVVDRQPGVGWMAARIQELVARHNPSGVVCDARGPAAAIIAKLEAAGVDVDVTDAQEMTRACGVLFDLVQERDVRHLGSGDLESAVKGAGQRTVGDAWAWSRRSSSVDITPLVAVTLAVGRVASAWSSEPMVVFA